MPEPAAPETGDPTGAPVIGDSLGSRHTAGALAPPVSRAGRNLPAAIGVGVGLGAVVVLSLVVVKEFFLPILVVAVCIGAWEMWRALASRGIQGPLVPLLVGAASMLLGAYFRGAELLVVTFALTCVGMMFWRVADGLDGAARDLGGGVFVAIYPCFLGGFCALMLAEPDGHRRVFFFILVTVFSDIGGYAVGVLIGRHPMAPSLSPKKSWEGFAGSVVTCAAIGAAALPLLLEGRWWVGALIGALAAAAATIGDLIESSIKRDLGVKDMGTLLPGHGGLMDRLDSLVMTLPVIWGLLWWLVPTMSGS